MRAHRMLVPALVLAISVPVAAQNEVPEAFRNLKPYQIVEAVAAENQVLGLTAVQVRGLDSLRLAIRNEAHRYVNIPSRKAHQGVRMAPMISRRQAYADALAILTPDQRARAAARFDTAEYRLPVELQAQAGVPEPAEPLRHHAAGAAPPGQSTDSDSANDPLQHRGGETPPAVEAPGGKPGNPVTHR